ATVARHTAKASTSRTKGHTMKVTSSYLHPSDPHTFLQRQGRQHTAGLLQWSDGGRKLIADVQMRFFTRPLLHRFALGLCSLCPSSSCSEPVRASMNLGRGFPVKWGHEGKENHRNQKSWVPLRPA